MAFRQFARGRFSHGTATQPTFLLAQIVLVLVGALVFYGCNNTETPALNISGTVTGLAAGTHVTLTDSIGDDAVTTGNGSFVFPYIDQSNGYAVTVTTQPSGGNICVVANGTGTAVSGKPTNITVTCSPGITVGGMLMGLATGTSVTLLDNGGDSLQLSANGAFVFPTALVAGNLYAVTVSQQPANQDCVVTMGTGTTPSTDVTDVAVTCGSDNYNITVAVTSPGGNAILTVLLNGTDQISLAANGTANFNTSIPDGARYSVVIATQPAGLACTLSSNAVGIINAADVTVTVTCVPAPYTIGGTLANLAAGASVVLENNGGDALTLSANGSFTFAGTAGNTAGYAVTVSTPPTGQTCSVSNGSGTVQGASVTNVSVDCAATKFNVGVTVTGLTSSNTGLTLADNGTDVLPVSANGSFNFNTAIATGDGYAVTITMQPSGATCALGSNAIGTIAGAAVTVTLTCTVNSSPTLTSLAVTPASPSVMVGASQQFTATATYSDASTAIVTSQTTWTSAAPAIATVSSAGGLATGVTAGGPVTITGSYTQAGTTVTATAQLTVTAASAANCPAAPYTNPTYCGTITAETDVAENYTGTFGFALASGGQVTNCNATFVPVSTGQTVATACSGTWSGSTVTLLTSSSQVTLTGTLGTNSVSGTLNSADFGSEGAVLTGTFTGTEQ
jgi:large repetitive protein